MKNARFYSLDSASGPGARVTCFLCRHRCTIADGKTGQCGVRWNRQGILKTAAWGRVIARHVDPIEKKPLYHFLPGTRSYSVATTGCNFRCGFCQNWQISQFRTSEPVLPGEDLTPEEAVEEAGRADCASIAYTYTEPTIFFEYAAEIAELARRRGIANVFVTNGYESPEVLEVMEGLIDAANVDLKSFRDEFYRRFCKARLDPVLDTIRTLAEGPIHLEVTTLIVTGENDDEKELREIASFLAYLSPDIPWHVSRFHPDFKTLNKSPTPVDTVFRAVEIGKEAGLRYVYAGNVPGRDTDTACPQCGRPVILRSYMGVRSIDLDGTKCPQCGTEIAVVIK